jgi:hypothetical protein
MHDLFNVNTLSTGAIYRFKTDHVLGASIGLDQQGRTVYGVQGYWPLNIKR